MNDTPFRTVMTQKWRDLAFFHYCIPPALLQPYLPPGMEPDTHEGVSWIGFVPFWMHSIRPFGLPATPLRFHETNLRTYVRYGDLTGVWFFCLDADSPLAVNIGRAFYGLNYCDAGMEIRDCSKCLIYRGQRDSVNMSYWALATPSSELRTADPGSLEFFLLERYRLFSRKWGRLYTGEVRHEPYRYSWTSPEHLVESYSLAYGLPAGPYVHGVYSPGVDVEIGSLVRIA